MVFSAPAHRWRLHQPGSSGLMPLKARRLIGVAALAMLAFVLARFPLSLGAGGLLAIAFVVMTAIEPAIALVFLALMIPFGNLIPLPLPAGVNAVDVLVALAIATWLARGIARRDLRFNPPRLTWPILLFTWCLALSLTQAASWRLGVTEWIKWAQFGVVYLVACQILDRSHTKWVLAALFTAGLLEVGQGAYQFIRQVGPKEFILMGRFMRAYGTFNQPNPYAGYLGYLAPIAASLALGALGRWMEALRAGRASRLPLTGTSRAWREAGLGVACALVASLLIAGIIMSWSRGSWLGLGVALVVVVTLRARRSAPITAVGLIALAGALLAFGTSWLPGPIAQRLSDVDIYSANLDLGRVEVTDANFAVLERLGHWQAGADMFSDHPWLGVGIGNYTSAYAAYARPHFYGALGHAHDIYLNFLAETGIIGASAFILLWLAALGVAWRESRLTSGNAAALAVGVLGTLTYVSIHNVFDNLFVAHLQLQLALLLAMISSDGKKV